MEGDKPKYTYNLLKNVHLSLACPTKEGKSYLIKGDYTYYHYGCDGFQDMGWGCAYRTLQTMCSWIVNAQKRQTEIPNLREIQDILVNIGDKPAEFSGSRDWIGALEVFYTLDNLYDVSCKILHIPRCEDIKKYVSLIKQYFEKYGGLIMMGGDLDCSSKGIAGIHIVGNEAYLLILDPHFVGKATSADELQSKNYVRWQHTSDFMDSSFYNLCLPQLKFAQ